VCVCVCARAGVWACVEGGCADGIPAEEHDRNVGNINDHEEDRSPQRDLARLNKGEEHTNRNRVKEHVPV
jgi:hypothetical protein